MSNWKPKGQINITEALKRVWPEYPVASEMPVGDKTDTRLYKSMYAEDSTQTVYLIVNPATWEEREVPGSWPVKIRPKPIVLGKIADYTGPTELPAPDIASARAGQKRIDW